MDFSEKWGKDVDEATRLALIDLKLTIDDVVVTVLEEPSKGFFGLGSKLAKVRVEVKAEEKKPAPAVEKKEPVKVAEKEEAPIKTIKSADSEKPKAPEKKEGSKFTLRERPADLVEVEESPALTFLKEVTEKMGLSLTMMAYENESSIYVDIEGKDSGTIIGKRGATLDAIQYLTSLVVNKDKEKYIRVVVDAENYREKRERTLENLAFRLAEKVKRTRRSVRLEPMNPYERKVIHATLQGDSVVTTRSEGEEPYRRVIIELK